jgi:hypothetical protein
MLVPSVAHADVLWDWYYWPGCCECGSIITMAVQEVAAAHRLPIAPR